MSDNHDDAFKALCRYEPVPWHQIPDLGLYMDQVITFVGRIYQPVYGNDIKRFLSPAMINNYVKGKLIPRPTGKKYSREQIALLIIIVALKQVSSMEDIRRMLNTAEGESVEGLYVSFCERFSRVMRDVKSTPRSPDDTMNEALEYAILSSGFHACCLAALAGTESP